MRILGSVIAIASVMASVMAVVCGVLVGDNTAGSSTAPATTSAGESGPSLDGTYRVDVGNFITDNGQQLPNGAGTSDLMIRSACTDGACVATAAAPNAHEPNVLQSEVVAADLVLDYVDGRWIAVETWAGKCKPADGGDELDTANWDSFVLEPKPDGTLSGEYAGRGALETCAGSTRQRITLTRTGNADPGVMLPDPADPAGQEKHCRPAASAAPTITAPPTSPPTSRPARPAARNDLHRTDRVPSDRGPLSDIPVDEGGLLPGARLRRRQMDGDQRPVPGHLSTERDGDESQARRIPVAADTGGSTIAVVHGHVSEQALDGPCAGTSEFDNVADAHRRLSQSLGQEFDDALARLEGRVAVLFAHLHVNTEWAILPKPCALPFFELISITSNASPSRSLSVLKRSPGDSGSSLKRRPERAQSLVGGALLDHLQLAFGQPGVTLVLGRQTNRQRRLTQHRRQHAVVDRSGQREAAAPALADHPDALAGCLLVEVARQGAQIVRHRPIGIGRECREFLCHTTTQHDRACTGPHRRRAGRAVQRR